MQGDCCPSAQFLTTYVYKNLIMPSLTASSIYVLILKKIANFIAKEPVLNIHRYIAFRGEDEYSQISEDQGCNMEFAFRSRLVS